MSKKQQQGDKDKKAKVNYEELIWANLSNPKLSLDKTGYTFIELNLSEKNLDICPSAFASFKCLQRIDLSKNNLQDFSQLSNLVNLTHLNLESNNIKDIKPLANLTNEEGFKNLLNLNLNDNKIIELGQIKCPRLQRLNLNENRIDKFESFDGHPTLKILELRKNKINALQPLSNMPSLKELYLAENRIKTMNGLENLNALVHLNLRKNNIDGFDETVPNLENLQYLNLRENRIDKFEEIAKLSTLPNLKIFICSYNPIIFKNQAKYFFEIINILPKLTRLNKMHLTRNIKQQCLDYAEEKYKREQEEKARLEREAEEKAKLEEEQAAAATQNEN